MGAVSPTTLGLSVLHLSRLPAAFGGAVASVAVTVERAVAIGPAAKNAGHVCRPQVFLPAYFDEVADSGCVGDDPLTVRCELLSTPE